LIIEQTAEWIEVLGRHYNWNEATVYADIFALNEIWWRSLQWLSLDILKTGLGISNHEHCLKIFTAIDDLFPSMTVSENGSETMQIERSESPNIHSPMDLTS